MQLHTEKRNILSSSITATEEFTVQANAHMMAILSGLYSDIPWAIVREYGTNMLDGYIALPEDAKVIPPQIHVPTVLEPYIEFKDFGVGMDFDTVWKVYKTYGASTKTGNNEEVGGFGLGAKTAFCYEGCDSWSVESRFNGKRMVFSAARNEKGVPTLFHVTTLETEEPNGVTVRLPVAVNDFFKFRKAILRLAQFFPMEITITGESLQIPKNDYILKGKNWGIRKPDMAPSQLIMGNVPYPLDLHTPLYKRVESALLEPFAKSGFGLDIRVPVGAVDIVPSREALKYTEKTIKVLIAVLKECQAEVGKEFTKELDLQETEWDAIKFVTHAKSKIPSSLLSGLTAYTWKGKQLAFYGYNRSCQLLPDIEGIRARFPDLRIDEVSPNHKGGISRTEMKAPLAFTVHGAENKLVYIDDLRKGLVGRLRTFINTPANHYYSRSYSTVYLFKAEGLTMERLSELLGGYPVSLTSSLLLADEGKKEKKQKTNTISLQYYVSSGSINTKEVDKTAGGYYLRTNSKGLMEVTNPGVVLSFAVQLGVIKTDTEVFLIPRPNRKMEENPEWIELSSLLRGKVKEMIEENKDTLSSLGYWGSVIETPWGRFLSSLNTSELEEGTVAQKYAVQLKEHKEKEESMRELKNIAGAMGLYVGANTRVIPRDFLEELKKAYPMASYILTPYGYGGVSYTAHINAEILSYISMMDKHGKKEVAE